MGLFEFQTGIALPIEQLISAFDGRLRLFDGGEKLWIVPFFEFQYGSAKEGFSARVAAIKLLRSYGLIDESGKPLPLLPIDSPHTQGTVPVVSKEPTSIGIGIGIGNLEGGPGETKAPALPGETPSPAVFPISEPEIALAMETWAATLKHYRKVRNPDLADQTAIAQAMQRFGPQTVLLALEGVRFEKSRDGFDRGDNLNLANILDARKIQAHANRVEEKPRRQDHSKEVAC